MTRARLLSVLTACAVGALASPAHGADRWPLCVPRTAPVQIGVTQVSRSVDGRLVTLMLRSRAMGNVQPVRVLLPVHYDRSGATRYPVLYLLHGAGGSYRSWLDDDHIDRQLGGMPVITVMPNGSQGEGGAYRNGGYSDWYGTPPDGGADAPAWESFHIRELVPFIDAHFPTRASAAGRAIAGISMGGGGATKYAASYPGTFGYVGAFSGETHPLLPVAVNFQTKTCKWGDPVTQLTRWRDNDSTDLASNLRGVRVFIRSGDGTPGPFDTAQPPADPTAAAIRRYVLLIEFGAHLENQAFGKALRAAGVRDVNERYFPGSHTRPYWLRDTTEFVAWLKAQLGRPVTSRTTFSVRSAHRWFSAWGYAFTVHRATDEFLTVSARPGALTATGSGRVDVVTPPLRGRASGLRFTLRLGTQRRSCTAAWALHPGEPTHVKLRCNLPVTG